MKTYFTHLSSRVQIRKGYCLLFTGDAFEQEDEYIRLKNLYKGRSHHMLLYEMFSRDQVFVSCLPGMLLNRKMNISD